MHRFAIIIFTGLVLTACHYSQNKFSSLTDSLGQKKAAGKDSAALYNISPEIKPGACVFLNPDTSLSTVKLRDAETAQSIISDKDSIDENDEYHFQSKSGRETLTLTQHAGDGKYQISIFKVTYSGKSSPSYRKLSIDTFKTEKAIQLGLHKKQIIERLGTCYLAQDSSGDYIELYYRLEIPNDNRTGILERNNMPVYYASYKLKRDRLETFEFGFEYP